MILFAYATIVGYESVSIPETVARLDGPELGSSSISQLDANPVGAMTNASVAVRALKKSFY
jgi:hypothetical protein